MTLLCHICSFFLSHITYKLIQSSHWFAPKYLDSRVQTFYKNKTFCAKFIHRMKRAQTVRSQTFLGTSAHTDYHIFNKIIIKIKIRFIIKNQMFNKIQPFEKRLYPLNSYRLYEDISCAKLCAKWYALQYFQMLAHTYKSLVFIRSYFQHLK